MNLVDLTHITPLGELAQRSALLAVRLQAPMYSARQVYDSPSKDSWPGDWEGRTILAQTMLACSSKEQSPYLDKIVAALPSHLNARGYLGEIYPENEFSEQQMSGHSWLLRGLCEYYRYRQDETVKPIIRGIVENLFLGARPYYASYPVRPEQRDNGGAESGSDAGKIGAWHISTDTGCAYIPIDGISSAYEIIGGHEILELLEEMIRNFLKIDFIKIKAQTHATLTAARGILRMYRLCGKTEYLKNAEDIFNLYVRCGMTANYENYNWFGRPEWTEPCAVIDSFILASELFMHTGKCQYAEYAQLIYYNGMGREQRPNGGFGCNNCTGNTDDFIRQHCYEAFWCCSMRGGEGLARAAQYGYFVKENRIVVPYLNSSYAEIPVGGEIIKIRQTTSYPYGGNAAFEISGVQSDKKIELQIYILPYTGQKEYELIPLTPENRHIALSFDIPFRTMVPEGDYNDKNKRLYLHGNLILGCNPGKEPDKNCLRHLGNGIYEDGNGVRLAPINNLYSLKQDESEKDTKKILFID